MHFETILNFHFTMSKLATMTNNELSRLELWENGHTNGRAVNWSKNSKKQFGIM